MSGTNNVARIQTGKQNARKKALNTIQKIHDAIERSKEDPEVKDIVLSISTLSDYAGVSRQWPYKAKNGGAFENEYAVLVQAFEARNKDVEYRIQYLTRPKKSKWAVFEGRISKLKAENEELKTRVEDLAGQVGLRMAEEHLWREKALAAEEEIKRLRELNRELEKQIDRSTPLNFVPKDRRS
jgi:uncharacterized protein YhaN